MIWGRGRYLHKLHLCTYSPTERQYTPTCSLCSSFKFVSKLYFQDVQLDCDGAAPCWKAVAFILPVRVATDRETCDCPSLQTVCQKAQKHVGSPTGLWHCHDTKWTANSMISSMKKVQLQGVWNEVMGHVPQHWPKGIAHFLAKRWISAMYPSSACSSGYLSSWNDLHHSAVLYSFSWS